MRHDLPARAGGVSLKVFAVILAAALSGATVLAHHTAPVALGSVRITQPVTVGGTVLQPGTYDLRDTGTHVTPLPGQSADAQARIEFLQNGMVVATDTAEVMTPDATRPVGTSGSTQPRAVAQLLRGGEFVRVAVTHAGDRYLIHLPVNSRF